MRPRAIQSTRTRGITTTPKTTMDEDPYELFSTPPGDLMLTSTPNKPTKRPLQVKNKDRQVNRRVDLKNDTEKEKKTNSSKATKIAGKNSAKKSRSKQKKDKSNLWDKCIQSDPNLAQFVDEFNNSLNEALSRPLDISGTD